MDAVLVLFLGLTPPLMSLWLLHHLETHAQERLRQTSQAVRPLSKPSRMVGDLHYIDGYGYVLGEVRCRYNARSVHLRCAVMPTGPCAGCPHFQESLESLN
jgi:hypothetical protein